MLSLSMFLLMTIVVTHPLSIASSSLVNLRIKKQAGWLFQHLVLAIVIADVLLEVKGRWVIGFEGLTYYRMHRR